MYPRAEMPTTCSTSFTIDAVVPQNSEPHTSKWLDLEMLLMPGGRERTEPEWRELMSKAGFEITRIVPMKAAESVIEARGKR